MLSDRIHAWKVFLVAWLIVLMFVGAGVAVLVYGVYAVFNAQRAAAWPTVRGEIDACHLESEEKSFAAKVIYTYQVDREVFHGNRIAFGYSATSNRSFHEQIVQKLMTSRYVQVHYNPNQPGQSCLATGVTRQNWLPVVLGAGWLLICFGIGVAGYCGESVAQMSDRLLVLNPGTVFDMCVFDDEEGDD